MTMMRVGLAGFALSANRKQELTRRLIDAFCAVEVGENVEIPEGGWGLGGRAVSIAHLAPIFEEDRQARIRDYLADR